MTQGIIKTENGFTVYDFDASKAVFDIGECKSASYKDAVDACCGKFFPESFRPYLTKAENIDKPDADTWENMIYADDHRGVWDNERKTWRNVTSMDRGAATEEEIAYVDALDATYKSLMAMSGR